MNSERYINRSMSIISSDWFCSPWRSVRIFSRAGCHGGQNEHRRELRDSMGEDNEFGDVTLVHDSDSRDRSKMWSAWREEVTSDENGKRNKK